MKKYVVLAAIVCLGSWSSGASASTILKFGFGADSMPDIASVGGVLSTVDDGNASTPGDQNSGIEFLGFLNSMSPIPIADASITIDGIQLTDDMSTIGNLVVQPTSGGVFSFWDETNSLLLSGTFGDGMLTGSLGDPATGSLISLNFGSFDGGSLINLVDPNSAAFSLSFTGVNDGAGFSIVENATRISDFTSDATGLLSAAVPEPASASLILAGLVGLCGLRRRK